jgi:hypothetical protein
MESVAANPQYKGGIERSVNTRAIPNPTTAWVMIVGIDTFSLE